MTAKLAQLREMQYRTEALPILDEIENEYAAAGRVVDQARAVQARYRVALEEISRHDHGVTGGPMLVAGLLPHEHYEHLKALARRALESPF